MSRKIWIGFVAVFVTTQVIEGLTNYFFLDPIYSVYSHIWRPIAEMKLWMLPIIGLFFSFFFVFIFSKGYERKGLLEGCTIRVLCCSDGRLAQCLRKLRDHANSLQACTTMVHIWDIRVCHCWCPIGGDLSDEAWHAILILKRLPLFGILQCIGENQFLFPTTVFVA